VSDGDLLLVEKLKKLAAELGRKPTRNEFVDSGVSHHYFRHLTFNGLLALAGLPVHPNQKTSLIDPFTPRILLIDIETAPLTVYTYGIREQHIGVSQIDQDWTLLSFAAKWLDSEEMIYHSVDPNDPRNDRALVQKAYDLLASADCVIAHNISFDVKMLKARFVFYDMISMKDFRRVCTYQIAKSNFRLTSNKLEYLARFLGVIEKLAHGKYPGMSLFKECALGNVDAFKELEDYNCRDVLTLEAIYLKLRRYDKRIKFNVFSQDNKCDCGSSEMRKIEPTITNQGVFKTYQCIECGKTLREKSNLLSTHLRSNLLT
jgi:hypothetical protein